MSIWQFMILAPRVIFLLTFFVASITFGLLLNFSLYCHNTYLVLASGFGLIVSVLLFVDCYRRWI